MSSAARHLVASPTQSSAKAGKRRNPQSAAVEPGRASNHAVSEALAGGVPLDPLLRAEMEARFGEDFADVRIHDDGAAHTAADRQLAHALTVGPHVWFGRGRFQPASGPGKRLLAHELAHVVQQSRPSSERGAPSHEADADAAAGAVVRGEPASVTSAAGVGVQREPMSDAEIAALPLDAVLARLDANEVEARPMVLSIEAVNALDRERQLLEARRAQLTGGVAPGINAPVPPPAPAPPPGVPAIKLEPERAETECEKRAHDERLRNHPADAQQAASLAAHGIEHYGVSPVPYSDGTGPHKIIRVGDYILGPNAIECQDRSYAVQFYIAYHVPSKENQWVVGPDAVAEFRSRYAKDKDLMEYEGSLHPYEVNSVRWVEKAMSGDLGGAFSHLGDAWSEAVRDPKWQVQALAASIPVERLVAPALRWGTQRAAPMVLAASMRSASEVLPPMAAREIPVLAQTTTRVAAAEMRPAVTAASAPLREMGTEASVAATAPVARQAVKGLPVAPMLSRGVATAGAQQLAPAANPASPTVAAPAGKPAPTAKAAKTPKQAKNPKPAAQPKPPKAVKAPKKPKQTQQQPKSIDEQIAQAEQDLKSSRQKTSDYFEKRAAGGRSRKGGPKKGIDNAKERVWMLKRQKAYPDRQMLKNCEVKGVQGPDGKLTPTESMAGVGREPDFIELQNGNATLGELKSEWELNKSLSGGPGTAQGGTTSVSPGSKMGGQFGAEDKVVAEARRMNGKIVITGYDVQTGQRIELALDPDKVRRGVFSSTSGWGAGNVWTQ